jgi:hypothetical protein
MNNDGVVIECGSLRIEFVWCADRYVHRILTSTPDGEYILTSREGRPDEKWPVSPPLQSLHLEDRPGGARVAMLVGMAGRSHWSMSVETDIARSRLLFDVACRVSEQPSWLGSSYDFSPLKDGSLTGLKIEPKLPAILQLESRERAAIFVPSETGPLPRTIRWGYFVTLRNDLGPH